MHRGDVHEDEPLRLSKRKDPFGFGHAAQHGGHF
jgi:hypothetical protein